MTNLIVTLFDTADEVAAAAAAHIAETLRAKPNAVLGAATGNSFRPVYQHLVALHKAGQSPFAGATTFNLDEYVGLPPGHPAAFATYMHECLFDLVDIDPARAHLPDVAQADLVAACRAYEEAIIAAGGIDLQFLGLGRNGHIGFNEPGSPHDSRTRQVTLTESTIVANTGDFPPGETPPPTAITMGVGTILEAREIMLVVTGEHKAEALHTALRGTESLDCPASALQNHANVHLFCDKAAAARL